MVQAILGLRSELHPVTDELRKRVQSIRVRSIQENEGRSAGRHGADNSWRNRPAVGMDKGKDKDKDKASPMPMPMPSPRPMPSSMPKVNSNSSIKSGNDWRTSVPVPGPMRFTSGQQSPRAQDHSTPTTPPTPHTPHTPSTPMRYVSRFHNGSKTGDDQILNTVILNKLNIFSVKTYDDVKQFLFQILGSDQKFVREFTWLVFRKAAAEEKFCGLFAKLLSEIQHEHPVILEEMRNLHTTYLDIWDSSGSADTKVDRRCRLGYSQFLAELTALGVLESDTMKQTLQTLKGCIVKCLNDEAQQTTVEEYMDCLRQLCGTKVPASVRLMIREMLNNDLTIWISKVKEEAPGLSSKSRFACMDLKDALRF
jgi:hypothetical protein